MNAWMLFRKLWNNVSLTDFIRHFVTAVMKVTGKNKKSSGPRRFPAELAKNMVRFNGKQHWILKGDEPYSRCHQCSRKTVYLCRICAVPVHLECMEDYHSVYLVWCKMMKLTYKQKGINYICKSWKILLLFSQIFLDSKNFYSMKEN